MPKEPLVDSEQIYEMIGQKIFHFRTKVGFSQQQLADAVQMQRSSISHIENGKKQTPLHVLYALCIVLDIELDDLLPRKGEVMSSLADAHTPYGTLEQVPLSVKDVISDYYNSDEEDDHVPS